jgi:adenosylmethionine-8-amino-7-oxononanoate aminotransferase
MSELKQWSELEQNKKVVRTTRYWVNYENERHIDIQCGNAAYVLGYNDGDVLEAMNKNPIDFLRGNSGESSDTNDQLIKYICERGNWASVAWAVSGSDAVEAALAMNDTYWHYKGQKKQKIISFAPGYHGTTMIAKHLRGEYRYFNRAEIVQAPMWRSLEQRDQQEQQALNSIREKLSTSNEIGCIIMETMPWVADISPYSKNWWESIRSLCDEFGILMIVDDVALCWGKMGTMFGWQAYGVQPDISALGKALTGGYSPLGAAVCNEKVSSVLSTRSWDHGHTWAPNMQGVAASLAATKKIQGLLSRVPYINSKLVEIGQELGLSNRGEGLFMCYDTPKNITLGQLSSAGMAATIPGLNCVKVISPLIADDEYFHELKTRLKTLL